MKLLLVYHKTKNENGVTLIIVAISIFMFLALTSLAVDLGHLFVAHNELQNAADAGALAGAGALYSNNGLSINIGANEIAYAAAIANVSDNKFVEINDPTSNNYDVQRGHWSFGLRDLPAGFYPSDNTETVVLWDVEPEELDENRNFINAVRVVARREKQKIGSFFARIFGYDGFQQSASAVAYIGFAGKLRPQDVDQPIAICKNAITNESGGYTCNVGRMVTESNERETAAWTDFEQPDLCTGGTNANDLKPLICSGGNPHTIVLGKDMQVINGQVESVFDDFWDCWWKNSKGGTQPWQMTLPVIDCSESAGKVKPCEEVLGAVTVNIVWVNDKASDKKVIDDAPSTDNNCRPCGAPINMAGFGDYQNWSADITIPGEQRWANFVSNFKLELGSDDPMDGWTKKTIFFVPDCQEHDLKGLTGGENFGILAKIPVLVK